MCFHAETLRRRTESPQRDTQHLTVDRTQTTKRCSWHNGDTEYTTTTDKYILQFFLFFFLILTVMIKISTKIPEIRTGRADNSGIITVVIPMLTVQRVAHRTLHKVMLVSLAIYVTKYLSSCTSAKVRVRHSLRPFPWRIRQITVQYNITWLPGVNTIARGMFCGAKYTHHIFNHKRLNYNSK